MGEFSFSQFLIFSYQHLTAPKKPRKCNLKVVCLSAHYPFKKVIGVELSEELNNIAKRNIAKNMGKFKCKDIELVTSDVLDYEIPDDMTIAYLFDPFRGETFKKLIDKIHKSLERNPRDLSLIYGNPTMSEFLSTCKWLKLTNEIGRVMVFHIYSST